MEDANEKMVRDGNIEKTDQSWWKRKTKWQKTSFIISMVLLGLSLAFLVTLLFVRQIYGNELADLLYGEGVSNGFAALTNVIKSSNFGMRMLLTFITIVASFIIAFVLGLITKLITMNGSRKTQTTGSLIRSLIKYATILIALAVILSIWGVNITGIVASIGVLTLVIGLGCQTLIADIISGLFIVFDDYFSVGDMVIIDGFRGYVEEIGLRAVKVNDNCGNIKSINNGSISSAVNLSRQPNYISITMDASYNEDVERLEAVFARELPAIKDRMPQIVDGPWYKGIDNFDEGGVSYVFAFTTKAEYRFQATRDFKREIYKMFVDNDIIVPYRQIVVNPPDPKDRPKATDEEKKESAGVLKKNRAKKAAPKKQKFSEKFAKAYDDTVKGLKD